MMPVGFLGSIRWRVGLPAVCMLLAACLPALYQKSEPRSPAATPHGSPSAPSPSKTPLSMTDEDVLTQAAVATARARYLSVRYEFYFEPPGELSWVFLDSDEEADTATGDFHRVFLTRQSTTGTRQGMSPYEHSEVKSVGDTMYVQGPLVERVLDPPTLWVSLPSDGSRVPFGPNSPLESTAVSSALLPLGLRSVTRSDSGGLRDGYYGVFDESLYRKRSASAGFAEEVAGIPTGFQGLGLHVNLDEGGEHISRISGRAGAGGIASPRVPGAQVFWTYWMWTPEAVAFSPPPLAEYVTPIEELTGGPDTA